MLKNFVSNSWYSNVYLDVKISKLKSSNHFKMYGLQENRIPNSLVFLNSEGQSNSIVNLLISSLFSIISNTNSKQIRLFCYKMCLILEFNKIKGFSFELLSVSSWIGDGSRECANLYNMHFSKNSQLGVLRGIKNFSGNDFQPMILDIWSNGSIIKSVPILYPFFVLQKYNLKVKSITKIHFQHIFELEKLVVNILKSFNSVFTYFIQDYYLFTTTLHLYSEKESNRITLKEARNSNPNLKIDYNFIIRSIDYFICPSFSVYQNYRTFVPTKKLKWIYPPETSDLENYPVRIISSKIRHNVLIIGNMGLYKGSAILRLLIEHSKNLNLPYRFIHIGKNPILVESNFYENHYFLNRKDLINFAQKLDISFAFLPFQAEETYSFTLSDVFLLNLPLISTSVGSIPERCSSRVSTILLNPKAGVVEIIKSFDLMIQNSYKPTFFRNSMIDEKRKRDASEYLSLI
jgi:hypothetical protein